ncbi:hypothetical protein [Nostoc sp. PCC 9305]|uniref:hypothetical protein n=1 Tax=Nostoc sp. PCC 9305 TaxID=296636 RepID=UPI0039C63B20
MPTPQDIEKIFICKLDVFYVSGFFDILMLRSLLKTTDSISEFLGFKVLKYTKLESVALTSRIFLAQEHLNYSLLVYI